MEKNVLIREIEAMKRRMDRLYTESFPIGGDPEEDKPSEVPDWEPLVDIWENDESWLIVADLPGVDDKDIQVEAEENRLTISGRRKIGPAREGMRCSKIERPHGRFQRTFVLPSDTMLETIQAELKQGMLTITIPRRSSRTPSSHKVAVHSS